MLTILENGMGQGACVTSGIRSQNFDEKIDQYGRKCASQNGRPGRSLKSKMRQKNKKGPRPPSRKR